MINKAFYSDSPFNGLKDSLRIDLLRLKGNHSRDRKKAANGIKSVAPIQLDRMSFIRVHNSKAMTFFSSFWFFDCRWSYKRGYRFNFKKTWPILYLACDILTASTEIGPRTHKQLLVPELDEEKDPFIYVAVRVTANVLDLTNAQVRRKIGITLKDILIPTEKWEDDMVKGIWLTTHILGNLALNDGRIDGILYPSYPAHELLGARKKRCLAIFMDRYHPYMAKPMNPRTKLEVIDSKNFLVSSGFKF